MSVDPNQGPAYQYPLDIDLPQSPQPSDPGFTAAPRNPGGYSDGPLSGTPEGDAWIKANVVDLGYVIDWGNRNIIDPDTHEIKGKVPTEFPRVV